MRFSAFTDILELQFEEALEALHQLGLTTVDLRSRLGEDTVDTLTPTKAEWVRNAVRQRGLSVGCVASWGVNPLDGNYDPADPAYRQAMRERTGYLAALAQFLDAPGVRVYSFKRPARDVTEADRADNAQFLSELADICAGQGRILLVENEPPTLTATCAELADLMGRAVPANLKINWDIVNGWRAGETPWAAGAFEQIAGHIAHVHVKGARANRDGSFASMAIPGQDDVPHGELLRRLEASGFGGIVTIDPHYGQFDEKDKLAGVENPVLQVVQDTLAFLKNAARTPDIRVTRIGNAPQDGYAGTAIHWLAGSRTGNARELTLGRATIEPGGRNPLHRHPNCEEALYVLRGNIEHVIEGSPNLPMQTGDAIVIPRNRKHQAINTGTEPAELLVSFSSADRESILED